ncbi:MAG: hypothetical protein ACI4EG_09695 [Fusicatenibacter sp.]
MKQLIFSSDPYKMNWIREDFSYGEVACPADISVHREDHQEGDVYRTDFVFTNCSQKPVYTRVDSISIRFPMPDRYEGSDVCIPFRCNTHIFCGGPVSYVCALRMGGEAPHLGMVVTKGSLAGYSVERNVQYMSNDRGCFLLHPSPVKLAPGESMELSWTIFPHDGKEDFRRKLRSFAGYVEVCADRYVLFEGETARIRIRPSFTARCVKANGHLLQKCGESYVYEFPADRCGEQMISVDADEVHTWCRIFVQQPLYALAEKRCRFIAEKQQALETDGGLAGAYLIYDNEEQHRFYSAENDFNAGRERVGMGLLMAEYLKSKKASEKERKNLTESLHRYTEFVRRELVNPDTGEVCDDFGMDNRFHRLYNFPMYCDFFTECYWVDGSREHLKTAVQILEAYYRQDGEQFYPIELPLRRLADALKDAGMESERESLIHHCIQHADRVLALGVHYPAHEVNYEQGIVAPAAEILLQAYLLTGQEKYLEGGKRQIKILEQFTGIQPDYHLYEVAIRHWDGFWFGKRRLFGDTFPHYWSALNGNVYLLYYEITGEEEYRKKAEDSLRGVLPLFFGDGSASCAYVFPVTVNGQRAQYYDPYANDQDFGLYFNLRAALKFQNGKECIPDLLCAEVTV